MKPIVARPNQEEIRIIGKVVTIIRNHPATDFSARHGLLIPRKSFDLGAGSGYNTRDLWGMDRDTPCRAHAGS
ncbi:MAG: hypothetical protein HY349_06965 [Nitrospirae bacterium]|nr:hypothetical protein [Nitrospirota bacterium]